MNSYAPLLHPYIRQVFKYNMAHILLAMVLLFLLILTGLGIAFQAEALVALSIVSALLMGFLLYLIRIHTKEVLRTAALDCKENIVYQTKNLSHAERADLLLHLAQMPHMALTGGKIDFFCNRCSLVYMWHVWHLLKETLILAACDEHIACIRDTPLHVPYHASLANSYIMLSQHYQEPLQTKDESLFSGMYISSKQEELLTIKKNSCVQYALEELSIIHAFAPQELWVYDQLALSYKELNMPEKEIEAYEAILVISPDDYRARLRLGILYFLQGRSALGLTMYEALKKEQPICAEELLEHYSAYHPIL